ETKREEDKLSRHNLLGAANVARRRPAVVLDPFDFDDLDRLDVARLVAEEARGLHGVAARIASPQGLALFLAVIELVDFRPLRPGIVRGPLERRLGDDLQLQQAAAAAPPGGG